MNDMSQVIIPKSDQINADDLIAGPRTFRIEAVEVRPGTEQPVNIRLTGEGRVWRPCKSMSRVLVAAWGPDANVYAGRSITLYRDEKVKWGGMEIGGIRVSHLSHIDREMLLQLTATKGKRAPHIVKPLVIEQPKQPATDPASKWASGYLAKVNAAATADELNTFANSKATKLAELAGARPDLHEACVAALDARRASFASGFDEDPNANHGGSFTDDESPDVREAITTNIRQMIDAAIGAPSLQAASAELELHIEALDDAVAEELTVRLAEKRAELGEG